MNIADKIRNQFPEFIESEYPTFIKFVEHYYEFLESAELILENTNGVYTAGEKIVGQTSGLEATIRAVDHPNSRIFISTQNKFIISEEIRQIPSINTQGDRRVDLEAVSVRILELLTNGVPTGKSADALTTLLESVISGYQRGDIDNDEDVDISDAIEFFRFIDGLIAESDPKHVWIVDNIITPMESDYTTYSEWIPNPPLGVSNIVSYRPNPIQTIEQLLDYRDIDSTVAIFFDRFREEFMSSIPNKLANGIDKRNIIKNITDLYREKGTSVGHQLFFKMLLNDTAELYYPSEDILESSGGKWSFDTIVRVDKGTDISDISVLVGKKITQKNKPLSSTVHLATAIIESATLIYYGVVEVLELKINNESIKGKFIENENIYVIGTDNYEYTFVLSPLAVGVTISDPGQNYSISDEIRVDGFGMPVSMEVGDITSGYVNDISIRNGGSGYIDNESLIFNETNTNGQGTEAIISGVHGSITMEDGTLSLATQTDPVIIQEDYTVWLSGRSEDKFKFESGIGEITDTYISRYGQNYNRPPVITAPTGTGVELLPITTSVGSISEISILDPGFDYYGYINAIPDTTLILHSNTVSFVLNETVTTSSGGTGVVVSYKNDINLLKIKSLTGTANVDDTVTGNLSGGNGVVLLNTTATCIVDIGAVHSSIGKFVNEDGFISSFSKRIQDNYYYQNYSYLVKTAESIINWRSAVKSAVHPAGFAVFGEINIVTLLSSKMKVPTLNSTTYTPELFSTFKDIFHTVLRRRLGSDGYGVKNTNPLMGGEGSRDVSADGQYDVSSFHNYKIDWIYPTLYFQKYSNKAHTLNTIDRHKFITHQGYVQGALHPDTGETINETHGYMMMQFADYIISDFETDPFRKVNIPPPSEITTKTIP